LPPAVDAREAVPKNPEAAGTGTGSKPDAAAGQARAASDKNPATTGGACGPTEAPVLVYFPSGETVLRNVSRRPLADVTARAVARAQKCPQMKILLRGHADINGTRKDNV
jgi:outer membrane protein OmpA-like peptidoglycan-associated protein